MKIKFEEFGNKLSFRQMLQWENMHFFFAVLLVAIAPFTSKVLPLLGLLLFITWIFSREKGENIKYKSIFLAYYIWLLISAVFSSDFVFSLRYLEAQASMLVFPLIFMNATKLIRKKYHILFLIFVGCNLVALLICIVYAFLGYRSFLNGDFAMFFHRSYFAMYLAFSLSIVFLYYKEKRNTFPQKIFLIFLMMLFVLGIYFCSSRAGILATVPVLLIIFILSLKDKILLFLMLIFAILLPSFAFKYKNRVFNYSDIRSNIWESSLEVIDKKVENILFGVGVGDYHNELLAEYKKEDNQFLVATNYGTHNQYLFSFLTQGLIGLIILLLIFLLPLINSIKNKDYLFISFLFITGIHALFENILNIQHGVVFFMFFYGLLLVRQRIEYD